MDLKEFEKLLKSHDWYFNMSDDPRYYHAGKGSWDTLMRILEEHEDDPEYDKMFHKYCPWP